MTWSLRASRYGIGSDSRRRAGQRAEKIGERHKRVNGNHGLWHEAHGRTAFPRGHPLRQETPGAIGELTAEAAAAIDGPLMTRDVQYLARQRMPAVVNRYRARELRSM
jgi:hypothetical protein